MGDNGQRSPEQGVSLVPSVSVNFVGTLGFSIVLPFLVFLVTDWAGNALIYSVMGATSSAFQLVGKQWRGGRHLGLVDWWCNVRSDRIDRVCVFGDHPVRRFFAVISMLRFDHIPVEK